MAIEVTTDLTVISSCDSTSAGGTWSAGTADSDAKVEGTACLYVKYSSAGAKSVTFTPTTNLNLPAGSRIYFWVSWASKAMPDLKTNSGLSMRLYTDATHWSEWKIAGSDTLPHNGWICHILDTSITADSTDGTNGVTLSDIDIIYLKFNLSVKGNVSWDVLRYGTTMTITGGDSGTPATFASMLSADVSNAYGFVALNEGVYYLQGSFQIGTTTASTPTYFKDTSKIIAFTDKNVVSTGYTITIVGNASGTDTTKVYFGTKSGTAGISGCVFKPAGSIKYIITATNDDIDDLGLYGCSFIDAGAISLPTASSTREALNCNFENCAEVIPQTCKMQNCTFIGSDTRGVRIAGLSHNVSDCNFISCPHGLHVNFSSESPTLGLNGIVCSGSNGTSLWDIEHSASGNLIIDAVDSSISDAYVEETGGGNTTVNSSVDLTIQTVDIDNNGINDIRCYIEKAATIATSTRARSSNVATIGTGSTHGLGVGNSVVISGLGGTGYNGTHTVTTVPTTTSFTFANTGDDEGQTADTDGIIQVVLMNQLTETVDSEVGIAATTFNYPGSVVLITVRVRKSSTGTKYIPVSTSGTIKADGYNLTAVMYVDTLVA